MKKALMTTMIVAALALAGCVSGQTSPSADGSTPSSSPAQAAQASTSQPSSASGQSAQSSSNQTGETAANQQDTQDEAGVSSASTVTLQAGSTSMQMTLADTQAASALADLLRDGPISVSLHSYGGFEKVGELPQALPANDEQITTVPGDVMLYQGNQITIFYGSNTWAYTPLGHIENATAQEIIDAFGEGDVTVELSL